MGRGALMMKGSLEALLVLFLDSVYVANDSLIYM